MIIKKFLMLLFFYLMMFFMLNSNSYAATWAGLDGDWGDTTMWAGYHPPDEGEDVFINGGNSYSGYYFSEKSIKSIGKLTVSGGALSAAVYISCSNVEITGGTVGVGGTLSSSRYRNNRWYSSYWQWNFD
ncbi:hypothetical protein HZA55_05030 [Candidatus Poribacteria bacterium]|nr:hypothetical protein [Candidatus Poribacteria bacterium]